MEMMVSHTLVVLMVFETPFRSQNKSWYEPLSMLFQWIYSSHDHFEIVLYHEKIWYMSFKGESLDFLVTFGFHFAFSIYLASKKKPLRYYLPPSNPIYLLSSSHLIK